MFEINTFNKLGNDLFEMMDAMLRYPSSDKPITNMGLKSIIRRPHNLIEIRNDKNELIAYKIQVVTTPFDKNDVKIEVNNEDDILTVTCGKNEEEKLEKEKVYIYHGISSQSFSFSIKLPKNIEKEHIIAKNEDGILTIHMPVSKTKNNENKKFNINIE